MIDNSSFTLQEIKEFQLIHQEKRPSLWINFKGEVTQEKGSLLEKIFYAALCVFTLGQRTVWKRDQHYLEKVRHTLLRPKTDKVLTADRIAEVFRSLFPDTEKMQGIITTYQSSQRDGKKQAKREMKREICNHLQAGPFRGKRLHEVIEMVSCPRLAETAYAIQANIVPEEIHRGPDGVTYVLKDRNEQKKLAVFKYQENPIIKRFAEENLKKEVEVYETLATPSRIHVKETRFEELLIKGKREKGMFQKFIQGTTFNQWDTKDPELIEQYQFVVLFDLLNENSDRNRQNLMIDENNTIWSIDHGRVYSGNLYFPKFGMPIAHEELTETVKAHLQTLDIDTHVGESCRKLKKERAYYGRLLPFLQYAATRGLNLFLINRVLKEMHNVLKESTDDIFQKIILHGLLDARDGSSYRVLFGRNTVEKMKEYEKEKKWNVDDLIEKHKRLKKPEKVEKEIDLETVLALFAKDPTTISTGSAMDREIFNHVGKEMEKNPHYSEQQKQQWGKLVDTLFPTL